MSLEEIAAFNCVLLTNVVGRSDPFQRATDEETKFEPVTVSVKGEPPAAALDGLSAEMAGIGLLVVKAMAPDVPPPGAGLKTCTWAVPAEAMSLAGIAAFNCVLLTNVVGRSDPFQRATELEMNPEPFTVSVKPALPAVALPGATLLIAGTGFGRFGGGLAVPPPAQEHWLPADARQSRIPRR